MQNGVAASSNSLATNDNSFFNQLLSQPSPPTGFLANHPKLNNFVNQAEDTASMLGNFLMNSPPSAALEAIGTGVLAAASITKSIVSSKWMFGLFGGLDAGVQEALGAADGLDMRSQILANIADIRAGINASNFGIHAAIEATPYLDITTGLDQDVFWSGKGNREIAENFAVQSDKLTLEMTPGGQYLDSLKLFDNYISAQAIIPWQRISLLFAQNASGEVSAFVDGARPTSVFNQIEYPILLRNPNVTNIVFSPEVNPSNGFNF